MRWCFEWANWTLGTLWTPTSRAIYLGPLVLRTGLIDLNFDFPTSWHESHFVWSGRKSLVLMMDVCLARYAFGLRLPHEVRGSTGFSTVLFVGQAAVWWANFEKGVPPEMKKKCLFRWPRRTIA